MKLRLFLLTALLASSCQNPNDVGAKDTSRSQGPPIGFRYTSNPAHYTLNVAAPNNVIITDSGAPITKFSISPETLPAGLTFDTTTGQFTGTPTALTADDEYVITAYNGYGSRFVRLQLGVVDVVPVMTYGGTKTVSGHVGTPFTTITPTLSGGPLTSCTVSPAFPAGLTLSSACVISGTPTAAQNATVHTVTASNSGGNSSIAYTFTVIDNVPAFSYAGGPFNYVRGTALAGLTPTSTGGVITSCSSSPTLPAGLSLSSTCKITGTPTAVAAAANYTISGTNNGGSANAIANIAIVDTVPVVSYSGGPFVYTKGSVITALDVTNTGGVIDSCSVSPALPAGLALSTTTCRITGTPTAVTAAASYTVTATNTAGSANTTVNITVKDIPPTLAYAGSPYTYFNLTTITPRVAITGGGAITDCSSSPTLPAGLSISSVCTISGTPSSASAAANYVITATNSGGSANATINITVNEISPVLTYTGSPFTWTKAQPLTPLLANNTGGPITSCSSNVALPAGLSLSTACAISGVPTTPTAAANYVITGTNVAGSSSTTINITIIDSAPVISYTGSPFTYVNAQAIPTLSATNTGGAITGCTSAPALPTGLSVNATTCAISGTPTAVTAAANYTITATNSGGSSNATINIKVNDIPPSLVYSGSPFTFTQGTAITAINPTNAGGTVVSCTVLPALPAGLALSSTCDVTGTPTALTSATNYSITATNTGGTDTQSINITVNAAAPAISYAGSPFTYSAGVAITNLTPGNTGGTVTSCSSSPALPNGLSLSSTCVLSGIPTAYSAAANYVITATNTGGSSNDTINIAVNDYAPVISYSGSPFAYTKNQAIATLTPTSSGGTITGCSSSPALPTGLAISSACVISGTPTAITASANYTITATNSGGSANAVIAITVNDVAPTLAYTGSPFTYTQGTAITNLTPTNTGGTITGCAILPALPAGLALSSTCVVSGTPTVVSSATSYTITASNTGGTASASINITVNAAAPSISYAGSPFAYTAGSAISNLTPSNSGGTITGCSSSPALPAGLSLSSTCVLSGLPTAQTAAANYTITATNTGGSSNATINITVNDYPPAIAYLGSPYTYTKNVTITTASATNTGGAITSCSPSPALPTGLSLNNTTCAISGTPTAITGAASYTITALNAGGSSNATVTITVNDAVPVLSYTGSPFAFTKNVAISTLNPTNSGGAITGCSSSPTLPTGLSLSAGCVITGTPTAITASAAYVVTATNSGGSSNATITIAVNDAAPTLNYSPVTYTFTNGTAISTITPTTGGGTITGCSASPTLPAGLSLSSTCVITGTPTAVTAEDTYLITATNTGGSAAATLDLTVNDIAPSIAYAGSPFTYTKGTAISTLTPSNSGGTVTSCSSSPSLPAGLSLSNLCVISGTPTVVASATNYTITATNTGGSQGVSINITVNDVAPSLSYAGSPFTYVKGTAISTLTPTSSGGTVTGCSASPTLPAGLSLSSTCVLTGTPTAVAAAANYTITGTNSGGSSAPVINITVNDVVPGIAYSGPYTFNKNVAITTVTPSNSGGVPTNCTSSPSLPTGLSLSTSTCAISGTPTAVTAAANYTITASNSGGTASGVVVNITINDTPPAIAYTGSPYTFTKNVAISTAAGNNTGGTITSCSSSPSLPAGLAISNTTCNITGTPTAITATSNYTITASNAGGTSQQTLSITVNDAAPAFDYLPTSYTYTYTKGTAITTVTANNSGGTITSCTASPTLPNGLSLSQSTCTLSGTPTVVRSGQDYTITASNTGGSYQQIINVTVNDIAPAFAYTPSSNIFTVRTAISTWSPTSTGGGITSCSASPTLPSGLTLSTACVMTGTPTVASSSTSYTITGANSGGSTSASITIRVKDVPQILFYGKQALDGTDNGTAPSSQNIWKVSIDGVKVALTSNSNASMDSVNPTWSGDGSKVVYASKRATNGATDGTATGSYNIWTALPTGSGPTILNANTLTSRDSDDPPVVSPDGTQIAFASKMAINGSDNGTAAGSYNIWVMNIDGTSKVALTQNTDPGLDSHNPVWSPDGVWIYFSSKTATNGNDDGAPATSWNIWKVKATGANRTKLTSPSSSNQDSHAPAVSPDGTKVVYHSKLRSGIVFTNPSSFGIWIMNSDGSSNTNLIYNASANLDSKNVSYSPDGTTLVYISKEDVNAATANSYNVWTMTPSGTSQTALTRNNAANLDAANPQFTSDGTLIIFESKQDTSGSSSSSNIWIMTSAGTSQTYLTNNTNSGLDCHLAPLNSWYEEP